MKKNSALNIIFYVALLGMLFSGYLSYGELFTGVCSIGGCSYVLGAPACIYGFVMYAIVLVVSFLGIRGK